MTGLNSVDFSSELDSSPGLFANLIINSQQTTFNGRVGMRIGNIKGDEFEDTFESIVINEAGFIPDDSDLSLSLPATATINTDAIRSGTITFNTDVIVATGRSDYPNQLNNVLCFPGIFRGALDCHATEITEKMKMAAARAIAETIPEEN